MDHHNDLRYGITDLARKDFIPTHVCGNSLIFTCRAVQSPKAHLAGSTLLPLKKKIEAREQRGDLFIHYL